MFESGLRTKRYNQVAQERLFLCLESSICKASLAFIQPNPTYINLLVRVQLRVYPGSVMFVPTQNP
ncbi:Uncharacterised protein [Raoultella terrigena]|uniref:Uncharacterized protein n=1 Tax=Raoultella terrigena TaxID=577 RepID=A0A4V6J2D5_RAOTE|nr:Uncharacterised protein [Raoultella terrigena]